MGQLQRGRLYLSVPEKPTCILVMEALQVMLEIFRRPALSLASCSMVWMWTPSAEALMDPMS